MEKARAIYRIDLGSENNITQLVARQSSEFKIREKQIENWMATKPELLFSDPNSVMVFAQELCGEVMADMLAVDSQGGLIIIEIKRHGSDRNTIGQLLDYGARLASWTYDDFNRKWQTYSNSQKGLLEEFKGFVENQDFDPADFLRHRRLFILASSEDDSMKRIIAWLRDTYNVPIDFVPFQFYEDNGQVLLEVAKIEIETLSPDGWKRPSWSGDWFFNTNETYSKGAFRNILDQHVIAVYGYPDGEGERLLNQPAMNDRVFAYVNRIGIIAMGHIVGDECYSADSVFSKENEREFHRKVVWDVVVDPGKALSAQQSSQWGYNLPVRSTICRMYGGEISNRIAQELKNRIR